jgi:membrane protein
VSSRIDHWRLRALRIAARLRLTPLGALVERGYTGFTAIEPFDRAMTLAAQAFVSIVPVMIVTAAFRPNKQGFGSFLADSMGLSQATRDTLAGSVPTSASVGSSVGILGFLVALISATAYSRALERMYAKVWQVKRPGLRSAWRWLATVLAVILAVGLLELTRQATEGIPLPALWDFVVRVLVWAVVWTFIPWALLRAEIPIRVLAFTGTVTAVLLGILSIVGTIYLPIVLVSGAKQFGVLGLVFAYIGWLFALSFALVLACVIGRACAEDEGTLGRLVRGRDDSTAWQTV